MNLIRRISSLFHADTNGPGDHADTKQGTPDQPDEPKYIGYGIVPYEQDVFFTDSDGDQDWHTEITRVQGHILRDGDYIIVVDGEGGALHIQKSRAHAFVTHDDQESFESYAMHAELEVLNEGSDD